MTSDFHLRNLEDLSWITLCCLDGWTKAEMLEIEMSLHTSEEECVSDSIGPGVHIYISYMCIYNILYNDLLYYEENKS